MINIIMKFIISFFIIFYVFFIPLEAKIINNLIIEGNDRVSSQTIKVFSGFNEGSNINDNDLNEIIKELYNTNFFKEVSIEIKNDNLIITVLENPIIQEVLIEGIKKESFKKDIYDSLTLKNKSSYVEFIAKNDLQKIKNALRLTGFYLSDVKTSIKKNNNNTINLIYNINLGKKALIKNIKFIGDKKFKNRKLRQVIVSEENKFWKFLSKNTFLSNTNIELDKRLLINYYKSLGYYDVQVLSSNAEVSQDNLTNLTYTINAGTRYKVTKISTNISDVIDKNLFAPLQDSFKKIIGKYYSPFTVKKLLDELDILITRNDLQFIEHSVNEILEKDTIEVKINIYEGQKKLVERIDIFGNTVTDEGVIRSELLLDEGDPFNNLKLDQSIARLKARNIFGEIKKTVTDGTNSDKKIIELQVEEKPTGEISAGAGIGTSGGSLQFAISENNWLGKGINLITSMNLSAETFAGTLAVNNPNYNYSGNALNYFISHSSNDKPDSGFKNNITSTGIGTNFEQYRNVYISPNLSLSYDDLTVESTASTALAKQAGTFTDLSFDYGISLDNRDRVFAPTDGYVSSFNQAIPLYADSPYIRNSYAFSTYETLTPNIIGAFRFYATAINGLSNKDVRLSKRVSLSSSRLRGFESGKVGPKDGVDYVGGNYATVSNFEVSLPNFLPESTKTDIGLYLDIGNIWHVDYDPTLDDSNKIRSSAGINTSWASPVGPIAFIFSQNLSKASTDVTESFNFRLGTTF